MDKLLFNGCDPVAVPPKTLPLGVKFNSSLLVTIHILPTIVLQSLQVVMMKKDPHSRMWREERRDVHYCQPLSKGVCAKN